MNRLRNHLGAVFLVWSTVGLALAPLHLRPADVPGLGAPPWLSTLLLGGLRCGDFVFLLLAAAVIFVEAARWMGPVPAARAFALVATVSASVETLGTLTGWPFGNYHYTENLWPLLGGTLPLAIPLAWWTVVTGGMLLVSRLLPRAGPSTRALATALLATSFDFLLEPYAWQVKGYWIWRDGAIPPQNYAAWFALSFLLARAVRWPTPASHPPPSIARPAAVFTVMLALFTLARWA